MSVLLKFPDKLSRRLLARRPRRSKNGTPEERAAKRAAQAGRRCAQVLGRAGPSSGGRVRFGPGMLRSTVVPGSGSAGVGRWPITAVALPMTEPPRGRRRLLWGLFGSSTCTEFRRPCDRGVFDRAGPGRGPILGSGAGDARPSFRPGRRVVIVGWLTARRTPNGRSRFVTSDQFVVNGWLGFPPRSNHDVRNVIPLRDHRRGQAK